MPIFLYGNMIDLLAGWITFLFVCVRIICNFLRLLNIFHFPFTKLPNFSEQIMT